LPCYASVVTSLEELVAAEHRRWERPLVEEQVFGSVRPGDIARAFHQFAAEHLGAPIARARFYHVSVGCVAGIELADGRAVVIKAQSARRNPKVVEACRLVMHHLRERGFPCPTPIGRVVSDARTILAAEALVERGTKGDGGESAIRRAIAVSLARLVETARGFVDTDAFGAAWFSSVPDDHVFPRPHSPLFDFEGTRDGAAWIERFAREARADRRRAAGERVVGHFDWRVEHLRFAGGEVVASYDWDSLHAELETVLVGAAAHGFTADFSDEPRARFPTIDEARSFVEDYEAARGRRFMPAELATVARSWLYSTAYTARCAHARCPHREGGGGDPRPLLREHGDRVLREGL
jgi:hypothetical protein